MGRKYHVFSSVSYKIGPFKYLLILEHANVLGQCEPKSYNQSYFIWHLRPLKKGNKFPTGLVILKDCDNKAFTAIYSKLSTS